MAHVILSRYTNLMRSASTKPARWNRDTAGTRMTSKIPTFDPHEKVEDVVSAIRKRAKEWETITYVYVVDEWQKFIGVISLRELLSERTNQTIGSVCKRENLVVVHPNKHQERVIYMALKHNLNAIPVVDGDNRLLGVIPNDTILHILYKEAREDLLRLAGVHNGDSMQFDDVVSLSLWASFRHRFPWLLIGLLGGIGVARVIGFFEHTLETNLLLAMFIPLIVYMSGAVGTQMEAFMIRDLAIDRKMRFFPYFLRHFAVIGSMALCFGVLLCIITVFLFGDMRLSATLGAALIGAVLSSVCTGLGIPYILCRMKLDPANASGPIATIIQDFLSILIYFSIASALLS